jgi:hypothetical protein
VHVSNQANRAAATLKKLGDWRAGLTGQVKLNILLHLGDAGAHNCV